MPFTAPGISQLAQTFHALSDETRLRIISMLLDGERCVCELTASLDAAQSRLSFHLKVLKDAGLVTDRRDGRWVYYTLSSAVVHEAGEFLGGIRTQPAGWARRAPLPVNTDATCCD